MPVDQHFRPEHLVLLKKGFIIAIAHVREKHRDPNDLEPSIVKQRSVDDLIKVCEYLFANKYTTSDLLVGHATSAGAFLFAAAMNQNPSLFKGLVLKSPFLDILNTMLNAEIPLTHAESSEWGNPLRSPREFHYLRKICPYHNLESSKSSILIITGGRDQRVKPGSVLKYVAKTREIKNHGYCVLEYVPERGHQSDNESDESALELAFILDVVGYGK